MTSEVLMFLLGVILGFAVRGFIARELKTVGIEIASHFAPMFSSLHSRFDELKAKL